MVCCYKDRRFKNELENISYPVPCLFIFNIPLSFVAGVSFINTSIAPNILTHDAVL
jgi:hypothetical protein